MTLNAKIFKKSPNKLPQPYPTIMHLTLSCYQEKCSRDSTFRLEENPCPGYLFSRTNKKSGS